MLNIRGNSAAEVDSLVRDCEELLVVPVGGLVEALGPLAAIQAAFPETTVVGQPAQAQPAPQGVQGRSCQHGQMTYRTGNQGTPDAWAGYFCPLPRTDPAKCRPQYVGK